MRPGIAAAVVCSAAALALTGCGSDDATEEFPAGRWSYNDPAAGRGERVLDFRADGTYTVSDAFDEEQFTGSYSADGETLTIDDPLCGETEGTYAWSLRGEQLVLRAETDDCEQRRTSLDGTALTTVE